MKQEARASWGRYPHFKQHLHPCAWRDEIQHQLLQLTQSHGSTLAYGKGRSYGDTCLAASNHLLSMRGLDRFLSADWKQGIISCEAGITLEAISQVTIPKGWFLPVTPGTQYVTLGGAVANDVHGKNHLSKGTLGCHIHQLCLSRSDQDELICSPSQHPDYFAATIGGLGLTGIIKWVELQLMPISSSQIHTTSIRFNSLADFFRLSYELDHQHEYSAAWIDCLAKGKHAGRGIYILGDHAKTGSLCSSQKSRLSVPFTPPFTVLNKLTLKAFNSCYYHRHPSGTRHADSDYAAFFYPLDRLLHWNHIYGKNGLQQFQCVIPNDQAEDAISALLRVIAAYGQGSFLAVLKRCGDQQSPGLMSFPLPGISLALDFPQSAKLSTLFIQLNEIVRTANGRLYPAKDAQMPGEDFRRSYPQWTQVEALRDPALLSHFWQRVTHS